MKTYAWQTRQIPPQAGGMRPGGDPGSDLSYVLAVMQGAAPLDGGRLRLPDGQVLGRFPTKARSCPPAASGKSSRGSAKPGNAGRPHAETLTRNAALAAFDIAAATGHAETGDRSAKKAHGGPYIPGSQRQAFAARVSLPGRSDRIAKELLERCLEGHSLSEVEDWEGQLPEWLANIVGGVGETAPGRICPRCGTIGHSVQASTDKDGEPRWLCAACGRSYTARTGSFSAGSGHLRRKLGTFLTYVLEGRTAGEIAAAIGVCRATAGEWRKHLVSRMMLALGIGHAG
jgi:transposase-like protein